jgi:hypothetical protein
MPLARRSQSSESPGADDPLLQVYVVQKTAANLVVAAHRHPIALQGDAAHQIGSPFQRPARQLHCPGQKRAPAGTLARLRACPSNGCIEASATSYPKKVLGCGQKFFGFVLFELFIS